MIRKKKGTPEADLPMEENAAEMECEDTAEDILDEEEVAAEEVDPLEDELAHQKDMYLRLAAEYDNFRKRTQREKSAMGTDIRSDCIAELLPVLDNLERALSAQDADADTLRKGVEMVLTQASQIFEKLGVTAYGEVGDTFDPQVHNCVSTAESDEYDEGIITMVIQKGYMLGDKVIRAAMVQVAS